MAHRAVYKVHRFPMEGGAYMSNIEEHLQALVIVQLRCYDALILLLNSQDSDTALKLNELHEAGGVLTDNIILNVNDKETK